MGLLVICGWAKIRVVKGSFKSEAYDVLRGAEAFNDPKKDYTSYFTFSGR